MIRYYRHSTTPHLTTNIPSHSVLETNFSSSRALFERSMNAAWIVFIDL